MAFTSIDDITVDFFDEKINHQSVKQIDKIILSRGAWTTIMFLFQDWDRRKEKWNCPKATVIRYQKRNGVYSAQSKFKFTSSKQAKQIIDILQGWLSSGQFDDSGEECGDSENDD